MAYLFDTNYCIYLMNGWGRDENRLNREERSTVSAFKKLQNDVLYMCEASVGELFYGIERSQRKQYNLNRFKALLIAVPPVSVTLRVWEIYGQDKGRTK